MGNDFIEWLIREVNRRGWSNSELARRAGLGASTISMVLSDQSKPGFEFCVGIAQAFGEPPERVLRLAGLLPRLPAGEDVTLHEIVEAARHLSVEERGHVLAYVRWRLSVEREKRGSGSVGGLDVVESGA